MRVIGNGTTILVPVVLNSGCFASLNGCGDGRKLKQGTVGTLGAGEVAHLVLPW